jgi:hypothetical protein
VLFADIIKHHASSFRGHRLALVDTPACLKERRLTGAVFNDLYGLKWALSRLYPYL